MSKYYIYGLFHKRPKNNFISKLFYIGRGCNRRMNYHFHKSKLDSKNPINPYKNNLIKKCLENNCECYPKKLYDNLTLNKAKELEKFILNDDQIFNELTNISQSAHGGLNEIGEECDHSKLTSEKARHINGYFKTQINFNIKLLNIITYQNKSYLILNTTEVGNTSLQKNQKKFLIFLIFTKTEFQNK